MVSKEEAYKAVTSALNLCTVEDAHHLAVVVLVDTKKESVKVYGLNIDEEAVPMLLVEAAGEVANTVKSRKTLQ